MTGRDVLVIARWLTDTRTAVLWDPGSIPNIELKGCTWRLPEPGCVLPVCCWLVTKLCLSLLQSHGLQPARLLGPWPFPGPDYWSGLSCPPPGESSLPRGWTHTSCTGRWILYHWVTREALGLQAFVSKAASIQESCKLSCSRLFWRNGLFSIQIRINWEASEMQLLSLNKPENKWTAPLLQALSSQSLNVQGEKYRSALVSCRISLSTPTPWM